jgi:uncharacterized protein
MKTYLLSLTTMIFWLSSCQPHPVDKESRSLEDTKLLQQCLLCHDNKEMQRGPILDGLQEEYMLTQIAKFQWGQRGAHKFDYQGELMATAIKDFKQEDLEQSIALIARRAPRNYLRTVKGDANLGKEIYKAQCLTCHGEQAEGLKQFKTGSLAILEDWYLLTQLRNYKSGRRGYHEKDIEGQAMRAIVSSLSDRDLKNIVEYISNINLED